MNPTVKAILKKQISARAQQKLETRVEATLNELPVSHAAIVTEKLEKTTKRVKKATAAAKKVNRGVKKTKTAVNGVRRVVSLTVGAASLFLAVWALIPKAGKLFGLDLSDTFK